jgi:hypothetical protein
MADQFLKGGGIAFLCPANKQSVVWASAAGRQIRLC